MKTTRLWSIIVLSCCAVSSLASAAEPVAAPAISERMTHLVLQLAVIIVAAKSAGYVCETYCRIPAVLGELASGMIIGPYALGPMLGLFPVPGSGQFPVSAELYGIATVASILLLYLAGLETDLSRLLRHSLAGLLVGAGGVVVAFALGAAAAVWTGLAAGVTAPSALFLGTISTATSVGITARVLSERNKLDSAEGVTILAGAVIDDVIGVIALAAVVAMARFGTSGEGIHWATIAAIAAKAVGFWIVCTTAGLLAARRIGKILEFFGSRETMAALSLGLALVLAGLSEKAGLAMIVGAYIMGLSLSRIDLADEMRRRLEPMYHVLVSVFFCVMGMMVDIAAVRPVLLAGIVFSLIAAAAKLVGCAVPAMLAGFNTLGGVRIGVGMLPRGEVALIIAGVGLSTGFLGADVFGVAVLMTLVTTAAAPVLMVRLFDQRSGLRHPEQGQARVRYPISLKLPNVETADFLMSAVLKMFEDEECYVQPVTTGVPIYQIRKDDIAITARLDGTRIELSSGERDREFARLILLEAVASLIKVFEGLQEFEAGPGLGSQLLT